MPISEVMARAFNMEERFRTLMAYYRCAIMEVETKMRVLNETLSLQYDRNPIETIKSRLKNPKSIIEKMIRKGIAPTIENIEQNLNDIAGIRVICSFPEDVYLIARYLLQQDDVTLIEEKDYIKNPKPNGYRSLHLIIETPIFLADEKRMMRVEIQLRTIAMDFWASLEHKLHYKKNLACTEEIAEDLRICAEHSAQLDEEMQKIRTRIENAR
ncbi:MAG: GTP pyrophosphokinase family protein [Lachnospiraceae bacterium]